MRRLRIGDPPHQKSLRVRDEGEPTGRTTPGNSGRPALVCVHGAGSSSVIFMEVVRRLSPQRRVVAPDLPGHGQSDRWHAPADVTIEMYRDAVGTVCAQLGLERAVLLGHSMGGLVALAAAAAWPERVAGLVLVNRGGRLAAAPAIFARLRSDWPRFGKWLSKYTWSPATPIDVIQR